MSNNSNNNNNSNKNTTTIINNTNNTNNNSSNSNSSTHTVEYELWNIYTYYALHGNPRDPAHLTRNSLFKLCKEIMLLEVTMTEKLLTQADLNLLFNAQLAESKSARKANSFTAGADKCDRIDYDEYISCLIRIAKRCYPSCSDSEDALHQLLMDNVLPLASRRKPIDIAAYLQKPAIVALQIYYKEALSELFRFYATASDQNAKGKIMMRSTSSTSRRAKTFDEQKEELDEAKANSALQNSLANRLDYNDFIRFGQDMGFSALGLTILDLGDIYLSVLAMNSFKPALRKISFDEFWEAFVRCALIAYKEHKTLSAEDKLKGMFLALWRHLQSSVKSQLTGFINHSQGYFNSYKGGLMRGSQILNERFINAWTKDGYRDYLDTKSPVKKKATIEKAPTTVLNSLLSRKVLSMTSAQSPEKDEAKTTSVNIYIDDYEDFGDARIEATQLRKLLKDRPDIANLLSDCMREADITAK